MSLCNDVRRRWRRFLPDPPTTITSEKVSINDVANTTHPRWISYCIMIPERLGWDHGVNHLNDIILSKLSSKLLMNDILYPQKYVWNRRKRIFSWSVNTKKRLRWIICIWIYSLLHILSVLHCCNCRCILYLQGV